MSTLSDYTPDEQRVLLHSLQAAAVAVSAASLGRKTETASEGFAAASFIMERSPATIDNTLITSIQYELDQRAKRDESFPSYEKAAAAPEAEAQALETLRQVTALLKSGSAPEEAAGFKQWLLAIAQHTAVAGKEGGNFFGRGAVQVNDAERAALQEIAQILELPPA